VTVLGEVPDPAAALRELHRVLKPDGRLLVAEEVLDPDFIPLPRLRRLARETGFAVGDVAGWRFSYRALLSPAR
jgi:ubiquinone/menaquinone biosynthesis C-methylase UbiE